MQTSKQLSSLRFAIHIGKTLKVNVLGNKKGVKYVSEKENNMCYKIIFGYQLVVLAVVNN